jgi:hypothetical protein
VFLRGENLVGFSSFITFVGDFFALCSFEVDSVSPGFLRFFVGDTFVGGIFAVSLVEERTFRLKKSKCNIRNLMLCIYLGEQIWLT